jgi:hypothetical protein
MMVSGETTRNMAKESRPFGMVTDLKAIGKMTTHMANAYTTMRTAPVKLRSGETAR